MKISELTSDFVASYLRIDEVDELKSELKMAMDASLAFIAKRTGRTSDYIKSQDDLTYPYLVLCSDFINRKGVMQNDGQYINKAVYEIIDSHAVNLLPGESDLVGDDNA